MSKLSAIQIRTIKPLGKPYTLADGGGLSAHVAPSGIISWRYRYRYDGKATTQVLGKFPEMTLAEARVSHQKSRSLLRDGVNPTTVKKIEKLEKREYCSKNPSSQKIPFKQSQKNG